ncbi:MAG: hypothetical protein AAB787_01750 [Patescibacteria group bacterium]
MKNQNAIAVPAQIFTLTSGAAEVNRRLAAIVTARIMRADRPLRSK